MPKQNISCLDMNQVYSYADYLLWEFQERVELIGGRLFKMSPAPNTNHQKASGELHFQLYGFFRHKTCQVFDAPFDVRLPKKGKTTDDKILTVVQPDLCVICDPEKIDDKGCIGAPDLVVEILSPGNSRKEMKEKFLAYEAAGVREYWLVNTVEKMALVYILSNEGKLVGLPPVVEGDRLQSHIFPELIVDLYEVFSF